MSWVSVQLPPPRAGRGAHWPGRELAADVDLGHGGWTDSRPCRQAWLPSFRAAPLLLPRRGRWHTSRPSARGGDLCLSPCPLHHSVSLCATGPCCFLCSRWALVDRRGRCAQLAGAHMLTCPGNRRAGDGRQGLCSGLCEPWAAPVLPLQPRSPWPSSFLPNLLLIPGILVFSPSHRDFLSEEQRARGGALAV